jgi:hypothetical protein
MNSGVWIQLPSKHQTITHFFGHTFMIRLGYLAVWILSYIHSFLQQRSSGGPFTFFSRAWLNHCCIEEPLFETF